MKKVSKQELMIAQNGNCFYCFGPLMLTPGAMNDPLATTKDHFRPKCKGNKLNGNAVLAHAACNLKKGHREPTKSEVVRFKELYRKIKERRDGFIGLRKELLNG